MSDFVQTTVDGVLGVPGIRVEVANFAWAMPSATDEHIPEHQLILHLSPWFASARSYRPKDDGIGSYVNAGDLIFLPADVSVQSRAPGGSLRLLRCRYDRDLFEDVTGLSERWDRSMLAGCFDMRNTRLRQTLSQLAQEALAPGHASAKLTEALAIQAAVELARHVRTMEEHARPVGQSLSSWQMHKLDQYFRNFSGYLPDVSELADQCGISARHFRRLFKQTTRQTIHQFARDVWGSKAKMMLSETDMPMKTVWTAMGFASASSFSTAFRRATGESPNAFRQKFRRSR